MEEKGEFVLRAKFYWLRLDGGIRLSSAIYNDIRGKLTRCHSATDSSRNLFSLSTLCLFHHLQAAASLKRINLLLDQIEPANIAKSCKDDFCAAVSQLESQNLMFSDELLDNIKLVKSRFWKEVRN